MSPVRVAPGKESLFLAVATAIVWGSIWWRLAPPKTANIGLDYAAVMAAVDHPADQYHLVVYLSPQCPRCDELWSAMIRYKEAADSSAPLLYAYVVDDGASPELALALECAAVQRRFWAFAEVARDLTFSAVVSAIAEQAELPNLPDHADCVRRQRMKHALDARWQALQGEGGTVPTSFVEVGSERRRITTDSAMSLLGHGNK